jgi:hypothetical protein
VHKKLIIAVSVALIVMISGSFIFARPRKRPLTKMEVLALVAGHVFPANIVRDIQARGIAFTTDDNFNSLMTTAGAAPPAESPARRDASGILAHTGQGICRIAKPTFARRAPRNRARGAIS